MDKLNTDSDMDEIVQDRDAVSQIENTDARKVCLELSICLRNSHSQIMASFMLFTRHNRPLALRGHVISISLK